MDDLFNCFSDKKRSKKCLSDTSGTLPTSPNQCSHDSLPDSSTDFPTSETGCSTPLKGNFLYLFICFDLTIIMSNAI